MTPTASAEGRTIQSSTLLIYYKRTVAMYKVEPKVEPEDSQARVKYIHSMEVVPCSAEAGEVSGHEENNVDWGEALGHSKLFHIYEAGQGCACNSHQLVLRGRGGTRSTGSGDTTPANRGKIGDHRPDQAEEAKIQISQAGVERGSMEIRELTPEVLR